MEDNAELFIDPEEDEVFFYGVTEKESLVKSALENKMQLETKKINESCPSQNDYSSKDIEEKLQSETVLSTNKTHAGFEQITGLNLLSDSTDLLSVSFARTSKNENIADKHAVTVIHQESIKSLATKDYIESPKKQNTPGKKKLDERNDLPSVVNIHIDHSYSIPRRNVIDKDILKTPKTIVKADKDGGFLKILSEIALVKAEIDENNLGDIKRLTDIPSAEKLNNDDKENKQSDTEKANLGIKQGDLSPAKVCYGLTVNKANYEILKKNCCSFDNVNEEHLDCSGITDLRNEKIAEIVYEQFAENKKIELESFHTDLVLNDPIDELCLVRSLSLTDGRSNDTKIAFEKPDDSITHNNLANASGTTEKISDGPNVKEFDAIKGKYYDENIIPKGSEGLERICAFQNNCSEEESGITHAPLLKLPPADGSMVAEGKDNGYLTVSETNSSEKERRKKFIRRNTMRLLEELNEQVTFGQSKRESFGPVCNEKLSEEAAKVIQKLKAVGFDDSICSPEQYFDLDKLDSSVFNSEISDVLNDTLSKPLSHITSKDVESLLEKIKAHSLENVENEIYSDDEFNPRKEYSNNPKISKNFVNESERSTTDHQKSPDFEVKQFLGIYSNENNRSNCGISEQCENNKKVTEEMNLLCVNKKVIPSQPMPTRPKEFRSVEKKYRGLTRIPKLVSTTSKIPVTAKEVNQELGYRALNKTPFLKAQKSLRFNNIDSNVNMNVNPKTPVTFSSGKGRAGTKGDVINARMKSVNNKPNARYLFSKSETKFNPQFHRLKNGTNFKEHPTEGHAPKFVPKVLKGPCGDSPLVSKYGGSAQRIIPKRP